MFNQKTDLSSQTGTIIQFSPINLQRRKNFGIKKQIMKNRTITILATALFLMLVVNANGQSSKSDTTKIDYPVAKVSYDDYMDLVAAVEAHRKERLISLDTFIKMSQDENTIILDTRSKQKFDEIHIKGAVHLEFSEFTQRNLNRLIRGKNKRILIYCNNNFFGDMKNFGSKMGPSPSDNARAFFRNRTSVSLALNIPTYLNLFGYGFENVYELHEYVDVRDPRIKFEGDATGITKLPRFIGKLNTNSDSEIEEGKKD